MAAKSQQAQIIEKLDALASRIDQIEQKHHAPAWVQRIVEWRDSEINPETPTDIPSLYRFCRRSLRVSPMIYYSLIGFLYARSAIAIFIDSSSLRLLPPFGQVVASLMYAAVALGNYGCILFPNQRNQLSMVSPTVGAAIFACTLQIMLGVNSHQGGIIASALIFWMPMTVGHVIWGITIRGRVRHAAILTRLIAASESQASP